MELRITSRENEKVKQLCKLRESASFRQAQNCFLAEGVRLCRDIAAVCANDGLEALSPKPALP